MRDQLRMVGISQGPTYSAAFLKKGNKIDEVSGAHALVEELFVFFYQNRCSFFSSSHNSVSLECSTELLRRFSN